jgi:hypothetical protein
LVAFLLAAGHSVYVRHNDEQTRSWPVTSKRKRLEGGSMGRFKARESVTGASIFERFP